MDKSEVYFTNLRTKPGTNLLDKLESLVLKAGIENIDFKKKITAIKIHFGEPGNLAYIKPNYAGRVVKILKERGAIPFLTDTNTLYHGSRSNAPDHLEAASKNGFNPAVTDCHVIIADGVKGTDFVEIGTGLDLVPKAKIGSAIANAEIIISMNHFKGHEMLGFGGAIKNLGMGCAAVGGKLEMHSSSSPDIIKQNCTGCKVCEKYCAHKAIEVGSDRIAEIDHSLCVGCGQCVAVCQFDAARVVWDSASEVTSKKVAEYAKAALIDKPHFHINFLTDISPDCDCWDYNDYPLVADIGIAASFDPVALDFASASMVTDASALPGSRLTGTTQISYKKEDKFNHMHSNTNWRAGLVHAAECGIGYANFKLIVV